MADITMPQLGETVTEGTITKWFKQVGDQVKEDDVLFEVSTDKVDSEVPSPASGFLTEILVNEGDTVDVGTRLAVISADPASAPPAAPAAAQPDPASAPDDADLAQAGDDGTGTGTEEGGEPAQEEPAASSAGGQQRAAAPSAPADAAPVPADSSNPPPGRTGSASQLLSPVVRRLISEHDLDASSIEGTGAGGRITRNDVLAVIDGNGADRPQSPAQPAQGEPAAAAPAAPTAPTAPTAGVALQAAPPAPAASRAPAPSPVSATDRDEVVPFTNMRRRTAEHMVRSKATSAHTLIAIEVDYDGVDRVRLAQREHFKAEEGVSLTYLPFISRAVVDAVREFPHVNASVGNDELIVHRDIHLGIAVDIEFEGLMVPVIHGADGKRLRALAKEVADLASRARAKKLGPDDISGGTFTITNAGPFGTLITGAVINQPQVAILSTDGIKKRPVVVEASDGSDAIAIHPVGILALTFDHRAFDGAYAAAFLARVRDILETRDWAVELS